MSADASKPDQPVSFPQFGRCLCGEVVYRLTEDPLTVYLCHCTDCQTQSGTSFATSMIVRENAFQIVEGHPESVATRLEDGRVKRSHHCLRCRVRVAGLSSADGFMVVEPGTLDDTTWFRPVGHIWARSAQPWFPVPDDAIVIEEQPTPEQVVDLVRAWKESSRRTPNGN